PAIKAVITTPSNPSWVYEAVLIEQEERVFFITNGAIENDSFDEFYNSFKRIGSAGMLEVLMEQVEGNVFSLQDTIQIGLRTAGIFANAQTGVSHELFLVREDGTFAGLIGKIEAGQTSYDWEPATLKHYGGLDYSEEAPAAGSYRVVYVVWRPEIYRKDIAADIPDQDLTSGKTTFLNGEIQHYGGEDENELDPTDVLAAVDAGLFRLEVDTASTVTNTTPVQSENTYENSTYGFSMVFPASWGIMTESVRKGSDDTTADGSKFVASIILDSTSNGRYIKINVVKIEDKNAPAVVDYSHKYITENAIYSYYYTGAGCCVGMPGSEESDLEIQNEVKGIIETFEVS
ncbi:MAG: hypothetical protein Q8P90_02720, partial [bacterium]|nr:hypothetical protein [bacterium]